MGLRGEKSRVVWRSSPIIPPTPGTTTASSAPSRRRCAGQATPILSSASSCGARRFWSLSAVTPLSIISLRASAPYRLRTSPSAIATDHVPVGVS